MSDINEITKEEAKEIEDTLKNSMKEALDKLEVVLRKIAKNPLSHTTEQYQQIIWKTMTVYCAQQAGIPMIDQRPEYIVPETDIEA